MTPCGALKKGKSLFVRLDYQTQTMRPESLDALAKPPAQLTG